MSTFGKRLNALRAESGQAGQPGPGRPSSADARPGHTPLFDARANEQTVKAERAQTMTRLRASLERMGAARRTSPVPGSNAQ